MRAYFGSGDHDSTRRNASIGVLLGLLVGLPSAATAQDDPQPVIELHSRGQAPERQLVRASLPWPKGERRFQRSLAVRWQDREGDPIVVDSVPLLFWPDGSVRVEQLHLDLDVPPGRSELSCELVPDGEPASIEDTWPLVADGVPSLHFELLDPWERVYQARCADADWWVDLSASSNRVRVRRARTWCRLVTEDPDDSDQVLLEVELWLTEARGWPWAELTVALTNDPREGEPVFGPVRLRRFSMISSDPDLRALPRGAAQLDLPRPIVSARGFRQDLLAESGSLYLGDRTRLAFRFDLVLASAPEDGVARARALAERPVLALPSIDWVRATGAFGPLGTLAPVLDRDRALDGELQSLSDALDGLDRGAFGSFGEPRDGVRQGRLRCGPVVLHQILRTGSREVLRWSELSVLHHGLRPGPEPARLPDPQALLRQGIPPFAIEHPHGYSPIDYEHLTASLPFDLFWLTGDPFAHAECRRLEDMLDQVAASTPFPTSRGEGRLLQTVALLSGLDGDAELVQRFVERFVEQFAQQCSSDRAVVIPQPALPRALGEDHAFDATWQIAEIVRGLFAASAVLEGETANELRELGLKVATGLSVEGFVEGFGPKSLISSRDPATFTLVSRDDPFASTRLMLVDAFVLGDRLSTDEQESARFRGLADRIVAGVATTPLGLSEPRLRGDRWLQGYFDQRDR